MEERRDPKQEHPCGDLFINSSSTIYNSLTFSRFFEQNDKAVIGWAENVLAKLEGNGILPTFLNKTDNPDFKAFWGTITHLFALTVLYARKYKEIDTNQILFEMFIQNRGLVTSLVDSQEQMEYLFYNYLEEYSKRGRLDIIKQEGEILGELLRLIRYNSLDEFIFAMLRPEATGWSLGHSSPTWIRTNTVMNVTKGFEYSKGIDNLENYPLLIPESVNVTLDENGQDGKIFNAMTFFGNQAVGIDGRVDLSKLILIDPNLSYEISLQVKVSDTENENLKFGVAGYETTDGDPLPMGVIENGQLTGSSLWFHTAEYVNIPNEGMYYYLKGILLSTNERFKEAPALNFKTGRALSLMPTMKYIAPIFIQERTSASPYVYVYDFKVKPLYLPFSQGYLGERDIIAAYYKNNAYQSQGSIENFLKTYLIGYKNVFGSELIRPYEGEETYTILFKVFSNRNKYIANVNVVINGQTLKTNVNGETSIVLPRGHWYYQASAENFNEVEGVLNVTEDGVEYVQLEGAAYERVVTFFVRDSTTKDLMQNVRVTFAGITKFTGANGIATFEVFPGIYPYVVEYEDYYTVRRNAEIIDSTNIEVELEKIPYYNVTFRIRDGVDPVPSASILVTGEGIDNQTGSSNAQGLATGFVLAAGTYRYKVVKEMYVTQEADFTIYGDAIIDVQFHPVPRYDVTFIVRNNSLPVSKANVTFNGVTLQTDNNGKIVFTDIAGTYNWQVTKTEYQAQSGQITIVDKDIIKEIDLIQIGYTIDFDVVDTEGNAVSGATVTIGTEAITTVNGKAQFIRISGGYNWTVNKEGYYLQQGVVTVNGASQNVKVTLRLITYDVIFTVRIDGRPIAGQPVLLGAGSSAETLLTDPNGNAVFNKVPGNYPWSVERETYETKTGTAVVSNSPVAITVDLLKTTGTLVATVLDIETNDPINNAAVTINGETKYSNVNGKAGTWTLVTGGWPWVASQADYKSAAGNVDIVKGSNELTIKLTEKEAVAYNIKFVATADNDPAPNATISIDGVTAVTTDANGTVTVQLTAGTYFYSASYGTYFQDLRNSFTVYGDQQVNLNFIRRTTDVTVYVFNHQVESAYIEGASVTFDNRSSITDNRGNAHFSGIPMSSSSVRITASKQPTYNEATIYEAVTVENPTFKIGLGAISSTIYFTVRDEGGNLLNGVKVTVGGVSKTTSSPQDGKVAFSGYSPGSSFQWQATKSAYQSQNGSGSVGTDDVYINLTMIRNKCQVTYNVKTKNGSPIAGVTVEDNVSAGVTSSSGSLSWIVPAGDTYAWVASSPNYFTERGSYAVGPTETSKIIDIVMTDGAVLEVSVNAGTSVTLPVNNSASQGLNNFRVSWGDGTQTIGSTSHTYYNAGIKTILFDFNTQPATLLWVQPSAGLTSTLLRVVKWFTDTVRTQFSSYAFARCANLTSVPSWATSLISGSGDGFFSRCTSLKSVPAGILSFASSYIETYAYSGLSGAINLSDILGGGPVLNYTSCFESCKSITSVSGSLRPGNGCTIAYMFQDCTSLNSISSDIGARSISNFIAMFKGCTSLQTPCNINIGGSSGTIDGKFFAMDSGITSLPSNLFTGSAPGDGIVDFGSSFANCTRLSSIGTNVFGYSEATQSKASLTATFSGCTSLLDVSNLTLPTSSNCISTFEGSGVTVTSTLTFSKTARFCTKFDYCFRNCKNLRSVGSQGNFLIPAAIQRTVTVIGMFQGCTNLQTAMDAFGYSNATAGPTDKVYAGIFKYCTDYTNCFNGCVNLTEQPCWRGRIVNVSNITPMPIMFANLWATAIELPLDETLTRAGCFKDCTKVEQREMIVNYMPGWL